VSVDGGHGQHSGDSWEKKPPIIIADHHWRPTVRLISRGPPQRELLKP
jgi:hypothetical protein